MMEMITLDKFVLDLAFFGICSETSKFERLSRPCFKFLYRQDSLGLWTLTAFAA